MNQDYTSNVDNKERASGVACDRLRNGQYLSLGVKMCDHYSITYNNAAHCQINQIPS